MKVKVVTVSVVKDVTNKIQGAGGISLGVAFSSSLLLIVW